MAQFPGISKNLLGDGEMTYRNTFTELKKRPNDWNSPPGRWRAGSIAA